MEQNDNNNNNNSNDELLTRLIRIEEILTRERTVTPALSESAHGGSLATNRDVPYPKTLATTSANTQISTRSDADRDQRTNSARVPVRKAHIEDALIEYFGVQEDDVSTTMRDITINLMKPICNYIKEKILERGLPLTTIWSQIPDGIRDRAIDRFEQRAHTSLRINLERCKESWIGEYVLHQGWNNCAGPLKRKRRRQEQQHELTPSPTPDEETDDDSSTFANEDVDPSYNDSTISNHHSSELTSVRVTADGQGSYNEHESTLEKNRTDFYEESTSSYDIAMIRGSGHVSASATSSSSGIASGRGRGSGRGSKSGRGSGRGRGSRRASQGQQGDSGGSETPNSNQLSRPHNSEQGDSSTTSGIARPVRLVRRVVTRSQTKP